MFTFHCIRTPVSPKLLCTLLKVKQKDLLVRNGKENGFSLWHVRISFLFPNFNFKNR